MPNNVYQKEDLFESTDNQAIYPPPQYQAVRLIIKKESLPVLYINAEIDSVRNEGSLIVRVPKDSDEIPLSGGDSLFIEYSLQDALYESKCILDRITSDGQFTVLFLNSTCNLKRVQRRSMYRFPVSLPVTFFNVVLINDDDYSTSTAGGGINISVKNDNAAIYSGEITNISGTGLFMVTRSIVKESDKIRVEFQLHDVHLSLISLVVWFDPSKNGHNPSNRVGVHFENISMIDQSQICKFIFKEQRDHQKIKLV